MSFQAGFIKTASLTDHFSKAMLGGILGVGAASIAAGFANKNTFTKVLKEKKDEFKDANEVFKGFGGKVPKNVKLITTKDINNKIRSKDTGFFDRLRLKVVKEIIKDGNNAAADMKRKEILVHNKTHPQLVAHEVGHIIDEPKPGLMFALKYSTIPGILMGSQYGIEERAWNRAPIEVDPEIRDAALGTYANLRDYSRVGLLLGGLGGLGFSLLKATK